MFESLPPLQILIDKGAQIFAFEFGRYIIAAVLVASWAAIMLRTPWWRGRKIQKRHASATDIARELGLSLQTVLVYLSVIIFIAWGIDAGVLREFEGSFGVATDLLLLAAIILAHDAYFYWAHRIMHHPSLFRIFHRAHHRSITPTAFAAYAFALPEALVMVMFAPLWLLIVPTPASVMFAWMAVQILRNAMGHAGVELMPRWWLSSPLTSWISTTSHHDLHHAGSFSHNYGFYFTWWDKLMGTEHPDYAKRFSEAVASTSVEPKDAMNEWPALTHPYAEKNN